MIIGRHYYVRLMWNPALSCPMASGAWRDTSGMHRLHVAIEIDARTVALSRMSMNQHLRCDRYSKTICAACLIHDGDQPIGRRRPCITLVNTR